MFQENTLLQTKIYIYDENVKVPKSNFIVVFI